MTEMEGHQVPVDGFRHPVSARQQLMRLTAIAAALWQVEPILSSCQRVAVTVTPYSDVQISFHVHAPNEMEDATALVDALGLDPERFPKPYGRTIQHYWYGALGGFAALVAWVEYPAARDTQGRPPLPPGVGTGPVMPNVSNVHNGPAPVTGTDLHPVAWLGDQG